MKEVTVTKGIIQSTLSRFWRLFDLTEPFAILQPQDQGREGFYVV